MKKLYSLLLMLMVFAGTFTSCDTEFTFSKSISSRPAAGQGQAANITPQFEELPLHFTRQGFGGILMALEDSVIYFDSYDDSESQISYNPTYYRYYYQQKQQEELGSLELLGAYTWSYAWFNNCTLYYAPNLHAEDGSKSSNSHSLVKIDTLAPSVSLERDILQAEFIDFKINKLDEEHILLLASTRTPDGANYNGGYAYNINTKETKELFLEENPVEEPLSYFCAAVANNRIYVQKCRMYPSKEYALPKRHYIDVYTLDGTLEKTVEIPTRTVLYNRMYVWNNYICLQTLQGERCSEVVWRLHETTLEPVISLDINKNYWSVIDSNQSVTSEFPYVFFKNHHLSTSGITGVDIVAFNVNSGEHKSFKIAPEHFGIRNTGAYHFEEYYVDNNGNMVIQFREYAPNETDSSKFTTRHFLIRAEELARCVGL